LTKSYVKDVTFASRFAPGMLFLSQKASTSRVIIQRLSRI
jgi:hypothetical protein